MKERNRGYRRAQRARIKDKRIRGNYHGFKGYLPGGEVGLLINTPKSCSCFMCCNRRKVEGNSLFEKSADEAMKYELKHIE